MIMSFLMVTYRNRTRDFDVQVKSPSGGYVVLAADDVVRIKIHRNGTIVLDLDNVATGNGSYSQVTTQGDGASAHAQATLRLAQGDVQTLKGTYEVEVAVVDNSETSPADAIKSCETGVLEVVETPGGDIGA
jgi:hypothetical protein